MMINEAKELYLAFGIAIESCKKDKPSAIAVIECCFEVAGQYWQKLKHRLVGYHFPSEAEEIYFFKTVKPLFTSAIEYYGLLAHSQLFKDSGPDGDSLKKFYCREIQRLDKFKEANHDFYVYYTSGANHNDAAWFTRANNDGGNFLKAKPHDLDCNSATRYDYLVSTLIALEKYAVFLQANTPITGTGG